MRPPNTPCAPVVSCRVGWQAGGPFPGPIPACMFIADCCDKPRDRAPNCRGFHMRSDMVPGAIFPDYELSDHTAKHRKLSELQGQHPMVLVLSRGGYCPKDRRQAEGLVQLHRELEVSYCRLVTISTDNITETNEYRSGVGAHWPFLSDAGRMVQK